MNSNSRPTPSLLCIPRRLTAVITPQSAATHDVAMKRPIFVRATGTPTLRAATGSPPEPNTQLPMRVRASTHAPTAVSLRGMQSNEGVGREFEFIIAAVVGGCLLTGGYGSVVGTAFGAMIIGMAQIGIISSGWDSNWVYFFEGVVLISAVMLNTAIRRRAERAR